MKCFRSSFVSNEIDERKRKTQENSKHQSQVQRSFSTTFYLKKISIAPYSIGLKLLSKVLIVNKKQSSHSRMIKDKIQLVVLV